MQNCESAIKMAVKVGKISAELFQLSLLPFDTETYGQHRAHNYSSIPQNISLSSISDRPCTVLTPGLGSIEMGATKGNA